MRQGPQAPYVEGDMNNADIRAALRVLTQLMTTQDQVITNHLVAQANVGVIPQFQPNASNPTSGIRDFMRMKTPTFHGTKVDEDSQGFVDEVFKVVDAMGLTTRENAEFSYQLKNVVQVWFEQ